LKPSESVQPGGCSIAEVPEVSVVCKCFGVLICRSKPEELRKLLNRPDARLVVFRGREALVAPAQSPTARDSDGGVSAATPDSQVSSSAWPLPLLWQALFQLACIPSWNQCLSPHRPSGRRRCGGGWRACRPLFLSRASSILMSTMCWILRRAGHLAASGSALAASLAVAPSLRHAL